MGGLVGFNRNTNYHLVSLPFFSIEYFPIQSQLYFSCPSIDDVLIICKSIIPHNGADFYIIKFNTCPQCALTMLCFNKSCTIQSFCLSSWDGRQ